MSLQKWLPLESNPEVLNKYAYGIGMPDFWQFTDVYGLDPDLLAIVPQPVLAVVLLFPSTANAKTIPIGYVEAEFSTKMYFIKQTKTIGNACGTIALIHALANNTGIVDYDQTKTLGKFLVITKDMSPLERAAYLEMSPEMEAAHEESAKEGQTETPGRDDEVYYHFIALIHKDGFLYEMDGTKAGPVCHGRTDNDKFLTDAAVVVKQFMERDPDQLNFTVLALVDSNSTL